MRRRHPLYPEPGAWVLDGRSDLPSIDPPPLIPRKGRIPSGRIRDRYVAYEGLGFCVYEYLPPDVLEDPKLRKLWTEARDALRAIVRYLETVPNSPEVDSSEERRIAKPLRRRRVKEEAEESEESEDNPTEDTPFVLEGELL